MSKITHVHRDNSGEIELVQLDDGKIMSRIDAAAKAMSGELDLPDIIVAESKEGEPYLRSYPDRDRTNNLSDLPEIEDYSGYEGGPNMRKLRTELNFETKED